ncbi:hypothetical protein [Sorangium sp. So ce693]|uniref:hypothetical protein n=1 Tax=Sorangium sp. So ce693 TaxID=3133318 RepID=UPI003F63F67A
MKAAIIGECPPGQSPQELRVFDGCDLAATFLSSAIQKYTISGRSSQIDYCEIALVVDKNPGCIKQYARVEFLLTNNDGSLVTEFVGRVDGIRIRTSKGDPVTIEFRARGLAAPLVDNGFRGEVGSTVDAALATLVAPAGLRSRTDFPDQPLTAWINSDSTFAAVRLLGVNLSVDFAPRGARASRRRRASGARPSACGLNYNWLTPRASRRRTPPLPPTIISAGFIFN